MAKRGPKPKPTALKRLHGNPGKRELADEPQPDASMPRPPEHLGSIATAEWGRMARELNRIGLLTQVDRSAFAAYCCVYETWVEAEGEIERMRAEGINPYTYTTEKGNTVQRPIVGVRNKALELMLRYLGEFGLTPSSRSRVSVPNLEQDEFAADFGVKGQP